MSARVDASGTDHGGSPSISVVLFDLDDTLFAHRQAVANGIVAHVRALGLDDGDPAGIISTWHDLEEHHYHRYLRGELDFAGQRRARVRSFVEPFGLVLRDDSAADDWFADYFAEYTRAWTLHEDAIPALDALAVSPGRRIGLITNGDLRFQSLKIAAVGLSDRVEHVIASGEVGVVKPDPRIFEIAARRFGVDVSAAAYVGDRLHTDAIGAARAGMTGFWLDRPGAATLAELAEAETSGVMVISSLAELEPALRQGLPATGNPNSPPDGRAR